jgi:glucokinase
MSRSGDAHLGRLGVVEPRVALAIDIGGTKLAAAVVDAEGALVSWARTATPASGDPEQIWRALADLCTTVLEKAGVGSAAQLSGVGCGCGGPMEWPAGVVSPLNIPGWRAFPLRDRLVQRLPGPPVRVHNDATCMAAGEHWRGAGQGHASMLGVVVSTGVGGGLILDGKLINGASGNAGHIGHIIVDPVDGPICTCGARGCVEAIARGPALVRWAQSQGWRPGQDDATGRELSGDAAQGHPVGLAALRRAGRALGIGIASATSLCDLEVVCVGGGLSQAGPLLFEPLHEALRAYARLDFTRQVQVLPAALGQSAGLVGAAALIFQAERYWSPTDAALAGLPPR